MQQHERLSQNKDRSNSLVSLMSKSDSLTKPIIAPKAELWEEFTENLAICGKLLTMLNTRSFCLPLKRRGKWQLRYIVLTLDGFIIIYTDNTLGYVMQLKEVNNFKLCLKANRNEKRRCQIAMEWDIGTITILLLEHEIFPWRDFLLRAYDGLEETPDCCSKQTQTTLLCDTRNNSNIDSSLIESEPTTISVNNKTEDNCSASLSSLGLKNKSGFIVSSSNSPVGPISFKSSLSATPTKTTTRAYIEPTTQTHRSSSRSVETAKIFPETEEPLSDMPLKKEDQNNEPFELLDDPISIIPESTCSQIENGCLGHNRMQQYHNPLVRPSAKTAKLSSQPPNPLLFSSTSHSESDKNKSCITDPSQRGPDTPERGLKDFSNRNEAMDGMTKLDKPTRSPGPRKSTYQKKAEKEKNRDVTIFTVVSRKKLFESTA